MPTFKVDAKSINYTISFIDILKKRGFSVNDIVIVYTGDGSTISERYSTSDDLISVLSPLRNTDDSICTYGRIAKINKLVLTNNNKPDLIDNGFVVSDIGNSNLITRQGRLNSFKTSIVQSSIGRYKTLITNLVSEYNTNISTISQVVETGRYVQPCYVEEGYTVIE